ncbi:tetratricopeptide repeat protein [Herbidospora mongoliensis]|uniref:tetratricopeptide repeat protein n=1 Tax=Herbidospora mongoliensis TaxID=688067 RepID=UPI0034E2312D
MPQYQEALRLARQVHSPVDEGRALEGIAQCMARTGDRDTALVSLGEAVAIYRRIGAPAARQAAAYLAELESEVHGRTILQEPVQESTD